MVEAGFRPQSELTLAQLRQRRQAALRHGLRAQAAPNLRGRHRRSGRLLRELKRHLVYLDPIDLPVARAWCELEILRADNFAALMGAEVAARDRLLEQYLSIVRAQLPYSRELGLSPASRLAFEQASTSIKGARAAQEAQAELMERYGKPQVVEAAP